MHILLCMLVVVAKGEEEASEILTFLKLKYMFLRDHSLQIINLYVVRGVHVGGGLVEQQLCR